MNNEEQNINMSNQTMTSNVTTYQTSNQNIPPKKENKNIITIIIIIVAMIVSFIGGMYYDKTFNAKSADKCTDDTTNNNTDDLLSRNYTFNNFNPKASEIKAGNEDELTKGIEIKNIFFNPKSKEAYSKYREAYVYGKNNNSVPVHINIITEYYDESGKRIDKTTAYSYVYAGSEFVSRLDVKDDSLYKTVKISYTTDKNKSYETTINSDQFEVTTNITTDKTITAFIKNNSDQKALYIDVVCLYYKAGKVVFAVKGYVSGIESGKTEEAKFYTNQYLRLAPEYNSEMMEFDDYKAFIQGARYSNEDAY